MKPTNVLLILMPLLDPSPQAADQNDLSSGSVEGLSCSAYVAGDEIHAGDPILVEVTCENSSDQPVRLRKPFGFIYGSVAWDIKPPGATDFQTAITPLAGTVCGLLGAPIYLEPRSTYISRALLATGRLGYGNRYQFILDRPGAYEIRCRVGLYEGSCVSDTVTFTVIPASAKAEGYIRTLAERDWPNGPSRSQEFDQLINELGAASPDWGVGFSSVSTSKLARKYFGDEEGYQAPLLLGQAYALLEERDSDKQEMGFAKLDELLGRPGLDPCWKRAVTEVKAYHLARLGRQEEARAILKDIKHESLVTKGAKTYLPEEGREKTGTTQPAQNNSQKTVPTAIITVPGRDS
jgi:hypothetical protein